MIFYTGIIGVLALSSAILPASDGKADNVRICVSGDPLINKATHTVKSCDLLARSKKTHATCVFGTDRLDCLRLVSDRKADFTVIEAEDLVFADMVQLRSIVVVSEIRQLEKVPYESKGVVIVRSSRNVLPDLRGARLCHPGWEENQEKNAMFSQFLEERLAPQSCVENISLQEDRLRASAAYFSKACKAGPWMEDPEENGRLKEAYPSLCALCDQPQHCSKSDKYWGKGGAATCLKDGAGDALWTTYDAAKIHFQLAESPESTAEFSFLCMNGSTQSLTVGEPCFWMARPWPTIVANVKAAKDVQKIMEVVKAENNPDWKENLLNVIETFSEYIVNLESRKTPHDYLDNIPGFSSVLEMVNCKPPHQIKWCTLPGEQLSKCSWISAAATAFGIQPKITCVQRPTVEECIKKVADKEADFVAVPADYIPLAKLQYKLAPMFYEGFKNHDASYRLYAYVKKTSNIFKLSDLKSQRACFTLHEGLSWRAALVGLRRANLASATCNASGVLQDFFGHLCVSHGMGSKEVPQCCEGDGAQSDPDLAAFACLAKGGCDVAFVKAMSLPRRTDGNATSSGWYEEDYRRVCMEGDSGGCEWVWSASTALMTSASPQTFTYKEMFHVLSQLSRQFVRRNKKNNIMLSLFGPFHDESNIIFQDGSTGFTVNSGEGFRSAQEIEDETKYCSKSRRIVSVPLLSTLSVFIALFSQIL